MVDNGLTNDILKELEGDEGVNDYPPTGPLHIQKSRFH